MNSDMFVNNSSEVNTKSEASNFFINSTNESCVSMENMPTRHLNDIDANILEEDAYKDIDNEILKLELQISKLEEAISNIEEKIKLAIEVGEQDKYLYLCKQKLQLKNELNTLLEKYNTASFSAKLSGMFNFSKNKSFQILNKVLLNKFTLNFLPKFSKKINSLFELRESLSKLENINKNVDELMTLQTPYGETNIKYEQLSKYITKANSIQSNISKYLK